MRIALKVAQIGNQGRPAFHAANRDRPDEVKSTDAKSGPNETRRYGFGNQVLFSTPRPAQGRPGGGIMHPELELTYGVESYQAQHKVKWQEPNVLAAPTSGLGYASTSAPTENLGRVTLNAYELHPLHDVVRGALRLADILDWLELCTVPWTELGQPPLLHLSVGRQAAYGYLESFDPQVSEWLDDAYEGGEGLISEVSFSLALRRETDPQGLFKKKDLPRSNYEVLGGSGGITGGLVTAPELRGSAQAATFKAYEAKRAQQATAAAAAEARRARASGQLINSKPTPKDTTATAPPSGGGASPSPAPPAGSSATTGASNAPLAPAPKLGPVVKTDPKTTVVTAAKPTTQQRAYLQQAGVPAANTRIVRAEAEVVGGSQKVAVEFVAMPNGVSIAATPKVTVTQVLPTVPLPKP